MVRIASVVAPGMPHHSTQRGNRRLSVFFCDNDYQTYLCLLSMYCARYAVAVWAYCLAPNYVHLAAVRYMELNPVRAGLVTDADAYPCSSARAHLSGADDGVAQVEPLCSEIDNRESFLRLEGEESVQVRLHSCQRTGRPCGDATFISQVESLCGRTLHPQKTGPKGKKNAR